MLVIQTVRLSLCDLSGHRFRFRFGFGVGLENTRINLILSYGNGRHNRRVFSVEAKRGTDRNFLRCLGSWYEIQLCTMQTSVRTFI